MYSSKKWFPAFRLSAYASRPQKLAAYAGLLALLFSLLQPATNSYADYPPANGFTWSIQPRFGLTDSRGIINFHWFETTAIYDYSYINPSSYAIDFNACATSLEDYLGATSNTYNWTFTGRDDPSYVQMASTNNCRPTFSLPKQGNYHARMVKIVNGSPVYFGATPFVEQDIYIKDYLVVALGDSYGAGEGAPDIQSQPSGGLFGGYTDPVWQDKRCHRSAKSPAAQAAIMLENSDPHTAVTFLSFACSGANITRPYNAGDGYDPGDPTKPQGSGILGPYRGMQPPTDSYDPATFLPAQLDQVSFAVGNRQIDALIMSAGGNDMGFAPLAYTCLKESNCSSTQVFDRFKAAAGDPNPKSPLSDVFNTDLGAMDAAYTALNQRINQLNVKKVFITEYPDATKDQNGNLCTQMLEDNSFSLLGYKIDSSEVSWLASTVIPPVNAQSLNGMNGQVLAAANKFNWNYVDGVAADFGTHGYCSTNNWINRLSQSKSIENRDNDAGMHPNATGYSNIATHILQHLQPNLSLNPVQLSDGMLIKGSGANVYAYYKGVRFLIPNASVAAAAGYTNYNNPTIVSDLQLNGIPVATNDVLVQGVGDPAIWAIYNNTRFVVPASLLPGVFDPAKLITLPTAMLNTIPAAGDGTLVQAQANAKTWNGLSAIYGGARFSIPSQAIFSAAGYNQSNISLLPQPLLDSITTNTDGVVLRTPDSNSLWIMQGGVRLPYTGNATAHVMPNALFNIIPAGQPGVATITTALALSNYTPLINTSVRATFTVTNTGGQALTLTDLTAAVRDSVGNSFDFPHVTNITLIPGQSYSYSQSRTFALADIYTTYTAALINGNWVNPSGTSKSFTVMEPCGVNCRK